MTRRLGHQESLNPGLRSADDEYHFISDIQVRCGLVIFVTMLLILHSSNKSPSVGECELRNNCQKDIIENRIFSLLES